MASVGEDLQDYLVQITHQMCDSPGDAVGHILKDLS